MILSKLPLLALLTACRLRASSVFQKKLKASILTRTRSILICIRIPNFRRMKLQTATKLAARLRSAGYDVTEHVGGTGVVAILKNGPGPVIMLRTELDALPVEEKTGLPYASKVHTKDDAGHDVPVMHACGHDLHMAALLGTAEIMARSKNTWHGTLMLIGQPAEETIGGAEGMIRDGLFTRFPKPDVAVALHVGNALPAGMVSITPGVYNTNCRFGSHHDLWQGRAWRHAAYDDRSDRDRRPDHSRAADDCVARSQARRNGGRDSWVHSGGHQEQHHP